MRVNLIRHTEIDSVCLHVCSTRGTERNCLTWGMAPHSICNILLCCFSYNITRRASHHYIPSQPRQKPLPLFTAPTQPFSGLCHLIYAEDDSRSAIWGVRAAEESLSLPLSTSIIQHLCLPPPPLFFSLLSPSSHCLCCCYSLTFALQHSLHNRRYQSSENHPSGALRQAAQVGWAPNKVLLCLHVMQSLWCVKCMPTVCIF